MILTEATLAELHPELVERLKMAHGKPVMITVTHIDDTKDNKFQYWMMTNNEFSHNDIYKTLCHLGKQAIDNSQMRSVSRRNFCASCEPVNDLKVVETIKPQLQVRKPANLRG